MVRAPTAIVIRRSASGSTGPQSPLARFARLAYHPAGHSLEASPRLTRAFTQVATDEKLFRGRRAGCKATEWSIADFEALAQQRHDL
jgi:hypothetical protein